MVVNKDGSKNSTVNHSISSHVREIIEDVVNNNQVTSRSYKRKSVDQIQSKEPKKSKASFQVESDEEVDGILRTPIILNPLRKVVVQTDREVNEEFEPYRDRFSRSAQVEDDVTIEEIQAIEASERRDRRDGTFNNNHQLRESQPNLINSIGASLSNENINRVLSSLLQSNQTIQSTQSVLLERLLSENPNSNSSLRSQEKPLKVITSNLHPKLNSFYGKQDEDFESWYDNFDVCSRELRDCDPDKHLQLFESYMQGMAQTAFSGLDARDKRTVESASA